MDGCKRGSRNSHVSPGGGGSNVPKSFDKQEKKNKIKRRGLSVGRDPSIYSAPVWSKSYLAIETAFRTIKNMTSPGVSLIPQNTSDMIILNTKVIAWLCITCFWLFGGGGGGFWGNIPQKIFGLNGVKACNFIRNMMETYFQESRDHKFKMYDDLG